MLSGSRSGKVTDQIPVQGGGRWARIHARTTKLGTYVGGFQAFSDQFAKILIDNGVHIHFNSPVSKIGSI